MNKIHVALRPCLRTVSRTQFARLQSSYGKSSTTSRATEGDGRNLGDEEKSEIRVVSGEQI